MLEIFRSIIDKRHEYAKSLKAKGKLLAGYMCTHIPEEILYGAGIVPVRILSAHTSQALTKSYIHETYCSFSHDCAYEGLMKNYEYLDLLVMGSSCLHMSEAFNVWLRFGGFNERNFLLTFPHIIETRHSSQLMVNSFKEFSRFIEHFTKRPQTNEGIEESIKIYNKNRRLLKKLWELLDTTNITLKGFNIAIITLASQIMDKKECNEMMEKFLNGLEFNSDEGTSKIKLMVMGGPCDDIRIFDLIESIDENIKLVFIDSCTAARYFWYEVPEDWPDKFLALSEGYINRIPCPSKDNIPGTGEKKRFRFIQDFIEKFRPDGIIFLYQRFCSPQPHDIVAFKPVLNKLGIPSLEFELDTTFPSNQFRTRLEAFLEVIKGVGNW